MYMEVKINALIPYWCRAVAVQSYEYCDGTILVCSYWGGKKSKSLIGWQMHQWGDIRKIFRKSTAVF